MSPGGGAAEAGHGAWYGWSLGGLLPILIGGFLASAAANRLVFIGWALLFGACYLVTLRRWFAAGRARPPVGPVVAITAAVASFAWLAVRYGEELRLGFAALLPPDV